METTKKQKKHFEVPGTYVILTALIVLMILLTYILAAAPTISRKTARPLSPEPIITLKAIRPA